MISQIEPVLGPAAPLPPFSLTARVAAVDYESYYDKDYSIRGMSYWHYCHHPKFRAYLVSLVTNDGFRWVGDPAKAPWDKIRNHIWVSHNRPFDGSVHDALQEKGIVPSWEPVYWGNTSGLCAWLRAPRALAGAMKALYGVVRSKAIRDVEMKGKQWEEYSPDLQNRIVEYAGVDSDDCLRIWMDFIQTWPEKERRLSDALDERGLYGIYADKAGMEHDMSILRRVIFEAEQRIPWRDDPNEKALSTKAAAIECRKNGIPPPPSYDMKDEGMRLWEDEYGEKFPFVGAMRDLRRMNALLKKYEQIFARIMPNGRFQFPVSYLGTHTGRTSGRDKVEEARQGLNLLNLPRSPFFIKSDWTVAYRKEELKRIDAHYRGLEKARLPRALPEGYVAEIDLRRKLTPAPGYKFVICDKAQIEARVTNWLAREKETLDLIRKGFSVYDVHAMTTMGFTHPVNPDGTRPLNKKGNPIGLKDVDAALYALAKARELALGFQAGHVKFIVMAPTYVSDEEFEVIFNKPVTPEQVSEYLRYLEYTKQSRLIKEYEGLDDRWRRIRVNSWLQVQDFRAKKKRIVGLWKSMQEDLDRSVGGTHEVVLPSGRTLFYFNVTRTKDGVTAQTEKDGDFKFFYGGKLLENAVQATARDVFLEDQLNLLDAGIRVVLDVYDEIVAEVPLDFDGKIVEQIMSRSPDWAKTLPIGAEMEESAYYKK